MTSTIQDSSNMEHNELRTVYKTFDDGYVVRSMSKTDAKLVQHWYTSMGKISAHDLDIALESFPPDKPGFYIGEFAGEVVASAIRVPWGPGIYYGSYYYVAEKHRKMGFGTRLRDEVAAGYVGDNILCVDAVLGSVSETNKKFGYVEAFRTRRLEGVARKVEESDVTMDKNVKIVKGSDVHFDKLIDYDNICFISKDNLERRKFLLKWISIPDSATYVAINATNQIAGYGCRRSCLQERNHLIGPLYADSPEIAAAILSRLCVDVIDQQISINVWCPHKDSLALMEKFGFTQIFDLARMHVNGDPHEFKQRDFAITSIDICGF